MEGGDFSHPLNKIGNIKYLKKQAESTITGGFNDFINLRRNDIGVYRHPV
jgi:hypothetical protein